MADESTSASSEPVTEKTQVSGAIQPDRNHRENERAMIFENTCCPSEPNRLKVDPVNLALTLAIESIIRDDDAVSMTLAIDDEKYDRTIS